MRAWHQEYKTEGFDRGNLDLVGRQNDLVAELAASTAKEWFPSTLGRQSICHGLALSTQSSNADTGQEFGNALSNVLTGAVNPSGRSAYTWPLSVESTAAYGNFPGLNGHVNYED